MIELEQHTLHFKKPARTSRGEYTTRSVLLLRAPNGVGECSPLPDLSIDRDAYNNLDDVYRLIDSAKTPESLYHYPALRFALESLSSEKLSCTNFARGLVGLPINGLVWMSDADTMLLEAESKIKAGFRCIKFKIGSLDWNQELRLIETIRNRFPTIEIRLDANGAFSPSEAPEKLQDLSRFHIHSIEQPIKAGQIDEMADLCHRSPIPIALDEELIPIQDPSSKQSLLEAIRPSFLVLKPTLHGGISGTEEWVALSRHLSIGSWITSALESNIGLYYIAKLAAYLYGPSSIPQGLGTGQLFTDNIDYHIELRANQIWIK